MEELLKEFMQPILLIVGIAYAGTVCVKYVAGSFDSDIFDSENFGTGSHTTSKKGLAGLPIAIFAIIVYFL